LRFGRFTRKKSRSASQHVRTLLLAFIVDWMMWGYIAYGAMYLLNAYWYTMYVNWYGTLILPPWGWPLVVIATFELTLFGHVFGQTPGLSLYGLRLLDKDLRSPSFRRRLAYFARWHVELLLKLFRRRTLPDAQGHPKRVQMVVVEEVKDQIPATKPRKWYRTHRGLMTVALLVMTFWVGWLVTGIDLPTFFERAPRSAYMWKDLLTPSFEHLVNPEPVILRENPSMDPFQSTILGGIIESVFMALLATVVGALIAFPLSFLGARNIMGFSPVGWSIYALMRAFFNVFRSIESILWAIIFAIWVGHGPFAGSLALMIHTIAALGKLFSEQVEGVDPGPLEAIAATGGRRWQVVVFGVIPQVIPSYLAFSLYRWDINVRMSTVISLVGGGGIGRFLFFYKNSVGFISNNWNQVGAVVWTIVAVVWTLDYISGRVRERII
jgi:phosphonate transport system permease protein